MTTPAVAGRKLGRRPTDRRRLANTVRLRLTGVVPGHPVTADHLAAVRAWMMGGNDRFGTCGPTMLANYLVLLYKALTGEDITVSDDAVFDLYRRSGNPDFDPNAEPDPETGEVPGDNGVDMTVMLSALVKGGITITRADGSEELVKPYCFAAATTDPGTIRAVTSIFGAALLAVDLETAQQEQTDASPPLWDYAKSSDWGGHAIPGGAYTSASGKGQADESVISWKIKVGTTDAFTSRQLQEAYVVVFPVLWEHPGFQAGVDTAALAADYQAVTRQEFPVPVDPAPPGPVPPGPSPAPSPGADADDEAYWGEIRNWAHGEHVGANEHAARAARTWAQAKGLPGY